jgi:uncharacterized membrane protein YphA (DoxX/SURF4 family)
MMKLTGRNTSIVVEKLRSMSNKNELVGQRSTVSEVLQYVATVTSMAGGIMLVIPSWMAFLFFLMASICWVMFGYLNRHWGLVATQSFFLLINLIGLYRVFIGSWH